MGVPDFLKFVSRSAPGALCRIQRGVTVTFDFVLIDATNVAATIGLEQLVTFLCEKGIVVRRAVVLAVDSQRDRAGTGRHHRQSHVMVSDLDVEVQRVCGRLTKHYQTQAAVGGPRPPAVLMSGRHVAGEADYKLMDIHREVVARALAARETQLPAFLFLSEDSDVLCAALCGPAPQTVTIATTLRDTTFELLLLRVADVMAYVAVCVDALLPTDAPAAEQHNQQDQHHQQHQQQVDAPPEAGEEAEAVPNVPAPATEPKPDEDVVRRRKVDGPMVATGVRIELTDSSSDDEDESAKAPAAAAAEKAASSAAPAPAAPPTAASAAQTTVSAPAVVTPHHWVAAQITTASCVDLVFLFVVVMGNGLNVPPLVRGVTKVDITTCWQVYCRRKYELALPGDEAVGRTLLGGAVCGTRSVTVRDGHAALTLDCGFLQAVLEQAHYADALSRPPAEEEKDRAIAYLSNAVYATLRYIVACNLDSGAALTETFLDSRPLSEVEVVAPSLVAVLWVLSQESSRTFYYPMAGLPKEELLVASSAGAKGEGPAGADSGLAQRARRRHHHPSLQIDVGESLVAPAAAATSWAVRGTGSRLQPLRSLLTAQQQPGTAAAAGSMRQAGALVSVAAHLKRYAAVVHAELRQALETGGAMDSELLLTRRSPANVFHAMGIAWTYAAAQAIPELTALAKTGRFVSPQTGNVVEAPMANKGKGRGPRGANIAQADDAPQYVYSFELRRMAPVLTEDTAETVRGTSTSGTGVEPTAGPAGGSSSGQSAAKAAMMAALGVSLDYDVAPAPVPSSVVVKLPRSAMDPEDLEEMERLRKIARKEKEKQRRERVKPSATRRQPDPGAVVAGGDGAQKKKTSKRPGKRERVRLQKLHEAKREKKAAE